MSRLLAASVFVLLVCALTLSARPGASERRQGPTAQAEPQRIDIDAERFSFTPSEVRVRASAPVEFRLRSADTDHGFRILGTDVNIVIPKRGRGTATLTFTPPQAGRYVFECSKLCGAGHAYMRGTLIAE